MAFARQSRHHSILSARTYVRISGIGFVATRSVTRLPFVTSASGNDARLDASLRDKLGTPTYFDAHTNLATLGEFCHDGNHAVNDMIAVMLGNTITADIIMNGKLHHGGAGAIGHMALDPTGVQCHCGQRGCLETSAGTAAIIATAQSQGSAAITLAQVIAAANHGDAGCIAALERAGIALGTALANVVVMLNPGMIVLGGATMMAGDLLLTPARQVLLRHPRLAHKPQVRIVPIILGSRADAIDTRVPS